MNKPNRQPPRSFLFKATKWFNALRLMLVAAGRALKALRGSIQQVVLVSMALSAALHEYNEVAVDLLRKSAELLTGA